MVDVAETLLRLDFWPEILVLATLLGSYHTILFAYTTTGASVNGLSRDRM